MGWLAFASHVIGVNCTRLYLPFRCCRIRLRHRECRKWTTTGHIHRRTIQAEICRFELESEKKTPSYTTFNIRDRPYHVSYAAKQQFKYRYSSEAPHSFSPLTISISHSPRSGAKRHLHCERCLLDDDRMDFTSRSRSFSCGSFIIRMGASDAETEKSLRWTRQLFICICIMVLKIGYRQAIVELLGDGVSVVACCGSTFHIHKYIIHEWHPAALTRPTWPHMNDASHY